MTTAVHELASTHPEPSTTPPIRPEPVCVPYNELFPGEDLPVFEYGDPEDVFGVEPEQLFVDRHVYVIKREHPIGKIGMLRGDQMDVTADVVYHAMRLKVIKDDLDADRGGTYVFVLTHDAPPLSWDQVDMEEIEPNWPEGVVNWEEGSLPEILSRTDARKLRVNIDDLIRERHGDPGYRAEKPLRIKRLNLP